MWRCSRGIPRLAGRDRPFGIHPRNARPRSQGSRAALERRDLRTCEVEESFRKRPQTRANEHPRTCGGGNRQALGSRRMDRPRARLHNPRRPPRLRRRLVRPPDGRRQRLQDRRRPRIPDRQEPTARAARHPADPHSYRRPLRQACGIHRNRGRISRIRVNRRADDAPRFVHIVAPRHLPVPAHAVIRRGLHGRKDCDADVDLDHVACCDGRGDSRLRNRAAVYLGRARDG